MEPLPDEHIPKIRKYHLHSYATPYGSIAFRRQRDCTRDHIMPLAAVETIPNQTRWNALRSQYIRHHAA